MKIEKQIALYKEQNALLLRNMQAQYGSLARTPAVQSQISTVRSNISGLNAQNFTEESARINSSISGIRTNLNEARVASNNLGSTLVKDFAKFASWMVIASGFMTIINGIKEGAKAIVEFDTGLAGMKQTLEETYAEMGKQLDSTEMNKIGQGFLEVSQRWGASITEVLTAGKAWSRQYKDINEVMALVNNSVLLSVVDNVSLDNSVKSLEATMNQWGMTAKTAAEANEYSLSIVDKWSALAHKQMATANDLADANAKTGAVARLTGIDFDHMQGLNDSPLILVIM